MYTYIVCSWNIVFEYSGNCTDYCKFRPAARLQHQPTVISQTIPTCCSWNQKDQHQRRQTHSAALFDLRDHIYHYYIFMLVCFIFGDMNLCCGRVMRETRR